MATNKPQDEYMKTALRLPADLHARLHEAASSAGRSYNSEIVSRLQDSFGMGDLLVMDAELAKLRTENWHLEMVADLADSYRSLMGAMLLATLDALPSEQWPAEVGGHVLEVLAERDDRGSVFSILNLLERADPETVERLQAFASHIEDEGLDNVTMLARLKESLAAKRAERAEAKKVLVGNLGRPGAKSAYDEIGRTQEKLLQAILATQPAPVQLSKGPTPSKNARKPVAKKR